MGSWLLPIMLILLLFRGGLGVGTTATSGLDLTSILAALGL